MEERKVSVVQLNGGMDCARGGSLERSGETQVQLPICKRWAIHFKLRVVS